MADEAALHVPSKSPLLDSAPDAAIPAAAALGTEKQTAVAVLAVVASG